MTKAFARVALHRSDDGKKYSAVVEHFDERGTHIGTEGIGDYDTVGSLMVMVSDAVRDVLHARPDAAPVLLAAPEPVEPTPHTHPNAFVS